MAKQVEWLADAKKACESRDAFEFYFSKLPGKVKHLLKHMDPRSKSSRNTEKELEKFAEEEQTILKNLLKYHQAFPLGHKFKQERHKSKYKGKAKNLNHMIDKDKIKSFDKRS